MLIIVLFLYFFIPMLYASDEIFVEPQSVVTWNSICQDNKKHILDYWFYTQLKKHTCDNHQQLSHACADRNCFCQKPHTEKQYEINRTLLCALNYWQADCAMDYIIWHELARIRKNPTVLENMQKNDFMPSLFSYEYFTKNIANRSNFLNDFGIKFQERLAVYRSPVWTSVYNNKFETRWWAKNLIITLEPFYLTHDITKTGNDLTICLNTDGSILGLQDTVTQEEKYFAIPSLDPSSIDKETKQHITNRLVIKEKPEHFQFISPTAQFPESVDFNYDSAERHKQITWGTYLDKPERGYEICLAMPQDKTLMGETYILDSICPEGGDYEPLHGITYDQRHHVIHKKVPVYGNVSLWYPLKSKCSPHVRLIMEAMRGYSNKPMDPDNYKKRNTFAGLLKAPWKTPNNWLTNVLHKVYKDTENANTQYVLNHYINQKIQPVHTKLDVLYNIFNKHQIKFFKYEGIIASSGILAGLALGSTAIHKIMGLSYIKSFFSSLGLAATGLGYFIVRALKTQYKSDDGFVTPCHKTTKTYYPIRGEKTPIPSPITSMEIIQNDDI